MTVMTVKTWTDLADFFAPISGRVTGSRMVRKPDGGWVLAVGVRDEPTGPAFRHETEAQWARVFDALGIEWYYERIEEDIAKALRYRPDFWLPGPRCFVEVKSRPPGAGELRACEQLQRATGERVFMLAGSVKWGGFALYIWPGQTRVTRPDWATLAICTWADCGWSEVREALKNA